VIRVLPPPRLAMVLHLYHEEQTSEFQVCLKNIPRPFALFISTDTEEKKQQIEQAFMGWTKGPVEVRTIPNRGRDIAPKLICFRGIYEDNSLVLYLHSKKSPHAADLPTWRKFLLDCLLGSREGVAGDMETFKRRPDLGIVAPGTFGPIRRHLGWGNNFETCQALAQCMGISIARYGQLGRPGRCSGRVRRHCVLRGGRLHMDWRRRSTGRSAPRMPDQDPPPQ
jgi:lipopolysaccharide biosynthesis protein